MKNQLVAVHVSHTNGMPSIITIRRVGDSKVTRHKTYNSPTESQVCAFLNHAINHRVHTQNFAKKMTGTAHVAPITWLTKVLQYENGQESLPIYELS